MDPDTFSPSFFKWDPRSAMQPPPQPLLPLQPPPPPPPQAAIYSGLEELFQPYGIRYHTAAMISELGFTINTLLVMRDEELDQMMNSLCQIFRWDLLVGERYGIKAAIRAEKRHRLDDEDSRRRHLLSSDLEALSHGGLSGEPVQQEKEAVGSGGAGGGNNIMRRKKGRARMASSPEDDNDDDDENVDGGGSMCDQRQREHPFIVTEPGEVARGKKNGLDYLFHLYEECREFLIQVQNIAKASGEKCPTKVTNEVFRYAKKAGANYINKPKIRHYLHCYALHCLDEGASNALRTAFKERGENVGSWRQACYKPVVEIAARQGWDIDAIFNSHPRLSIWYVPTKLRQLCHAEWSCNIGVAAVAVPSSITAANDDDDHHHYLPF